MAGLRSRAAERRMDEVVHDVYTTMANTKVPHFALAIVWSFLRDRAARVASLVALESDSFTIDYSSPGSKIIASRSWDANRVHRSSRWAL
eukprot:3809485-Rhodomonas_salina.1